MDDPTSERVSSKEPQAIEHRPRQKAKPPMLNEELLKRGADQRARDAEKPAVQLSREQVSKAYDILEEQRVGPYAIKYGTFGSIGAIAYTYLRGFYYLSQKNRDAWMGTFRSRVFIMGPGAGCLPDRQQHPPATLQGAAGGAAAAPGHLHVRHSHSQADSQAGEGAPANRPDVRHACGGRRARAARQGGARGSRVPAVYCGRLSRGER
eukprot:XP_001699682.1 predicted protein [Chlamydomonas reinhardtii]